MLILNRALMSSLAAGFLMTLAACSTPSQDRVDVRGNYPDVGRGNAEADKNPGTLVVYTPTVEDRSASRSVIYGSDEPSHVVHSGFTIYDAGGNHVGYVRNHSMMPTTDESPSEIALAPGRYLIRTDLGAQGAEKFWVTVEAQRETRVDVARIQSERPAPEVR